MTASKSPIPKPIPTPSDPSKYDPFTDPKLETKQKTLSLLTHAANCREKPEDCDNKQCKGGKTMLQHIVKCKEVKCQAPFCAFAKFVLRHGPQIKKASDEAAARKKNVMLVVGGQAQKPDPKRYRHVYHRQRLRPAITTPAPLTGSFQSVCHQLNITQQGRPYSKKKRAKMKRKAMPVLPESKKEDKYTVNMEEVEDDGEESSSGSEFSSSSEEATVKFDDGDDSSSSSEEDSSSSSSDDDETMEKAHVFRDDAIFKNMEKSRARLRRGSLVKAPNSTTKMTTASSLQQQQAPTPATKSKNVATTSSRDQGPRVPARSYVTDSDDSNSSSDGSEYDNATDNVITVVDRSDRESESSSSEEEDEGGPANKKSLPNNDSGVSKPPSKIINKTASPTGTKRDKKEDSSSDESSSEEEEDGKNARDDPIKSSATTRDEGESSSDETSSGEDEDEEATPRVPKSAAVTQTKSKKPTISDDYAGSSGNSPGTGVEETWIRLKPEVASSPPAVIAADSDGESASHSSSSSSAVETREEQGAAAVSRSSAPRNRKATKDTATAPTAALSAPRDGSKNLRNGTGSNTGTANQVLAAVTSVNGAQYDSESSGRGGSRIRIEAKLMAIKAKCEFMAEKIFQLEDTNKSIEDVKEDLVQTKANLQARISSLEARLQEAMKLIESLKAAKVAQEKKLDSVCKERDSYRNAMGMVEGELNQAKNSSGSLSKQLTDIAVARKSALLEDDADRLSRENASLKKTLSTIVDRLETASDQVGSLHDFNSAPNHPIEIVREDIRGPFKDDYVLPREAQSVGISGGETDRDADDSPQNTDEHDVANIALEDKSARAPVKSRNIVVADDALLAQPPETKKSSVFDDSDSDSSDDHSLAEKAASPKTTPQSPTAGWIRLTKTDVVSNNDDRIKDINIKSIEVAEEKNLQDDADTGSRPTANGQKIADATPTHAPPPSMPSLALVPKKNSFLDDSDSDDSASSSNDDATTTPAPKPSLALDDSDSDDSVSSKEEAMTLPGPSASNGNKEVTTTPAPKPWLETLATLDDSDSDDSASSKEDAVTTPGPSASSSNEEATTPPASKPLQTIKPKKASFLDDSEKDDSASSKEDAATAPMPKPTLDLIPKKKSFLDDSDSDESHSSSEHDKKTLPAQQQQTPSRKKSFLDDSDSDGSSSSHSGTANIQNSTEHEANAQKLEDATNKAPAKTEVESKQEQPKQPMNDIIAQWKTQQAAGVLVAKDDDKEKEQQKSDKLAKPAKTEVESKQEQPGQSMNDIIAQWKTQQTAGVLGAKHDKPDKPAETEIESKQEQPKQSMDDILAQWKTQQTAGVLGGNDDDKEKEQEEDDKPAKRKWKWKTSAYTPTSIPTPVNRRNDDASSYSDKAPVEGQHRWGKRTIGAVSTVPDAGGKGKETSDMPVASTAEPFNRWKSAKNTANRTSWNTASATNASNASNLLPSKTSSTSQVPAWKAKLISEKSSATANRTSWNTASTMNALQASNSLPSKTSSTSQVPAWKAKLISEKSSATWNPQSSSNPVKSTQASQSHLKTASAQIAQKSAFTKWEGGAAMAEPSKVAPPPMTKPVLVEASQGIGNDDSDGLDWWKTPSSDGEWWSAGDPDSLEKLVMEALDLDDE